MQINQPYFLDNTIFGVRNSAIIAAAFKHVLTQMKIFIVLYSALILPIIIHLTFKYRLYKLKTYQGVFASITDCFQITRLDKPLLAVNINYFFLCFLLSTLVIVLSLGKHQGNYMTYLLQLMSPFLLIASITYLFNNKLLFTLGVPLITALYVQFYFFIPNNFSYDKSKWETLYAMMEPHDDIFASPMLTHELVRTGKDIRHAGHTFFFKLAASKPASFQQEIPEHRIDYLWNTYLTDLYNAIEQQKIDLIILNIWDIHGIFGAHPPPNSDLGGREFLDKYYEISTKVKVSMTDRPGGGNYTMLVYIPKASVD